MLSNDPEMIGRFMAEEWIIIGPDGSITPRAAFLQLIRSGELTHDVMESHELDIRVYGDAAVVIARGVSGGAWREEKFLVTERVSSVFIRASGEWSCVSTHLSKLG
jgi:hypothetical protein